MGMIRMLINFFLVLLLVIFFSYNIGYKLGKKRGQELMLRSTPLIFKEISLRKGYCIICGKSNMEYIDK